MSDETKKDGQRFSFQYLERPMGLTDSTRIRRRIYRVFTEVVPFEERGWQLASYIERETGEEVQWIGTNMDWDHFFKSCPLDTFLDCITLIARRWSDPGSRRLGHWLTECERVLREEQANYSLDRRGGVHPYVDPAFHLARQAAIAALQGPRYATSSASFAKAYDALQGSPVHARDAVRHAFDAVEALFKMMTGKARLTAGDVKGSLAVMIDQLAPGGDPVAQRANHQLLNSFADWVDASHHYRHAPGEAEPPDPPEAVWQLLMTQAAGFLRWLAQIDQSAERRKAQSPS